MRLYISHCNLYLDIGFGCVSVSSSDLDAWQVRKGDHKQEIGGNKQKEKED